MAGVAAGSWIWITISTKKLIGVVILTIVEHLVNVGKFAVADIPQNVGTFGVVEVIPRIDIDIVKSAYSSMVQAEST